MAALTPIVGSRFDSVIGDQRLVVAKFASVPTGSTWTPGFGVITDVNVTAGNLADVITVTVTPTSGSTLAFLTLTCSLTDTNTYISATGY